MSDELNPMARAFLESVQDADDPTRADYDRVHGKVKVRLAAGIAAGVAALTTTRAAATVTAKAATATAVATGVAAPTAAIATAGTGTAILGKIAAVVAVVAAVAAVGGGTTAVVHYTHRAPATAPAPTAITAPVVTQATPPRPSPRPTTVATAAPDTTAAPVASSSAPADLPRPMTPAAVVPAPAAPSAPAVPTATAVASAASLDAEIALLRDARAALRGGEAARSLALLDEHDRRFPGGALTEDCGAERVYALCALGQVDAARAAAARFLADHPYSPHAASVRASCVSPRGMN